MHCFNVNFICLIRVQVKGYIKPPEIVMSVLGAVMTLFGVPLDWSSAKKKISEADFLKQVSVDFNIEISARRAF